MGNHAFLTLYSLRILILCLILSKNRVMMDQKEKDLEDASEVTWAHAVNSREALLKELAGPLDFLEADVSLGYLKDMITKAPFPVMAHPPDVISDISLEEWLDMVIKSQSGKGVKLDFKSLSVVEPSLQILKARISELNFTLWLNADVLRGPVDPISLPIKDISFLTFCNKYFPSAVLSVGWTTNWYPSFPFHWHYEWKHVRKMAEVIKCFGYEDHFPKFTFPVRGIFASKSIKQLKWLLGVIPGSTLTVWTGPHDPLLLEDLVRIRTSFPKGKVYYDVPIRLQKNFFKVKDQVVYDPHQKVSFKDEQWVTLTHGAHHVCASSTYTSNDTIVFGSSLMTAVLLKKQLFVDANHFLKATGKINFFVGYEQPVVGSHHLKLVITDVALFSKNISEAGYDTMDHTGSDTDVLWEAINSSQLYTFEHTFLDSSSNCRIFKLDTTLDRSFQAWSVPCDDLNESRSFNDTVKDGIPEISSRKRMVLPDGPFMIGFVSSGEGHAVVYDFEVTVKDESVSNAPTLSVTSLKTLSILLFSLSVGYILMRYLH